MHFLGLVVVLLSMIIRSEALLNGWNKNRPSESRVTLERSFTGGNVGPQAPKDEIVLELEALTSAIKDPGLTRNYRGVADGLWRVEHAPHIRNLLEPLLFTDFDVYYQLKQGRMWSYVKFKTRFNPGICGHLNAAGTYDSIDADTTTIEWERVWLDFNKDTPSTVEETSKHVLPAVVQAVGKASFVKGVSVFPVSYLSERLIIFTFKLLGTRIVASKQ